MREEMSASYEHQANRFKTECIYLQGLRIGILDNKTGEITTTFTFPVKTIYNDLGYVVRENFKSKRIHEAGYKTMISILLLVAVKDRKVQGDEALKIEDALVEYQSISHFFWTILELFRSVSRMASRINMNVPDIIKNEDKAWRLVFEREINTKLKFSSKRKLTNQLRKVAKEIRGNSNPFGEADPELKIFIDYAFMLSTENKNTRRQANDIRSLRKHIRQRLTDFHKALTGLATHIDRTPSCQLVLRIDGRVWRRRIKNHLELLP
jgi:hypothetical protein